jgi:hypothetical protein
MPFHRPALSVVLPPVVALGLLLAIAAPKLLARPSHAVPPLLRAELGRILRAEEAFFADSGRYVGYDTTQLAFRSSPGVPAPVIVATRDRWTATVSHPSLPGYSCTVTVSVPDTSALNATDSTPVCR